MQLINERLGFEKYADQQSQTYPMFYQYLTSRANDATIDLDVLLSTEGLVNPCANGKGDDKACGRENKLVEVDKLVYVDEESADTPWTAIIIIGFIFLIVIMVLLVIVLR